MITRLPPRSNRNMMFDKVKWLTVNQLIVYHTLVTVFKIRQNIEPELLANKLRNDSRNGRIIIPNMKLRLVQKKAFAFVGQPIGMSCQKILGLNRILKHLKQNCRNGSPPTFQGFWIR